MKVIGLTGGIGSGKSTVSAYLISKGFPVIDADAISREIVLPGSTVLEKLVDVFGESILEEGGGLNRKKMAQIIFEDVHQKERLESIMHEEVAKQIDQRLKQLRQSKKFKAVFLDVPLLFESKADLPGRTDEVWVVDTEDEIRIERIQKRDGSTKDEILARMRNQMTRQEKNKRAHKIIENSGSEEELFQQIDQLIQRL